LLLLLSVLVGTFNISFLVEIFYFLLKAVEMASSKRQLEKRIEELDEEVDEQAEQIQLLEHVCETLVY
jgi:predicted tellurium resistance membrane protein TerC